MLLLITNRKVNTHFRLVPTSMSLDDLTGIMRSVTLHVSFGAYNRNLNEDRPILSATEMYLRILISGNIVSIVRIFEGVRWRVGIKCELGRRK